MLKVSVPANKVAAVALFSGKNDIRNYLNGVHIEVMNLETRIVATDGHTAGMYRHEGSNPTTFDVTIPTASIEIIMKTKALNMEVMCKDGIWTINGLPFEPCFGKFPAYRRIVPLSVTNEVAQFNPEYLMRVAKAGKLMKNKAMFVIHQNGSGASVARFNNDSDFIGIIMPWNPMATQTDNGMPTWGAK